MGVTCQLQESVGLDSIHSITPEKQANEPISSHTEAMAGKVHSAVQRIFPCIRNIST